MCSKAQGGHNIGTGSAKGIRSSDPGQMVVALLF